MPEAPSNTSRLRRNPRYTEAPLHTASKTLRVTGNRSGPVRTQLAVRGHSFIADQPEVRGGSDQGPSPMEYLAGGVSSCIAVAIEQLADRRDLPLTDISTYTLARRTPGDWQENRMFSPTFTPTGCSWSSRPPSRILRS